MLIILSVHLALVALGIITAGLLWRRRRRIAAVLAVLLVPAMMGGWYYATSLDSVASWLYPSDTEYADGFSRDRFWAVPIGSERQRLTKILGPPLEHRVLSDGREYWHYSRAGERFHNYWNFVAVVDANSGEVIELFSEFYTD